MANNINVVTISGRVHAIGLHETKNNSYVAEARLSVEVGNSLAQGALYDEFNIRAYGKNAVKFGKIEEGSYIVVSGKLKEDIRLNADNPNTTRSKTYINVDVVEEGNK